MMLDSSDFQEVLNHQIKEFLRPFCVRLDSELFIQAWQGDCAYYGFDNIQTGCDARDLFLFLVGLNATEPVQLKYVETPSGRSVHVRLIVQASGCFLVMFDATQQKVNYAELQQKGNQLALMQIEQLKLIEELKRLEKEVEAKRRLAEKANQLKGRFIATMSHEFRTPLTAIMGYASRLKPMNIDDATRNEYLASIERSANHLLSLVENLLDHSQIEVGSLTINPIETDVVRVLEKLSSIFRPLADDKSLEFKIETGSEIPDKLLLDEMRFRQILVNLISNAIKYTDYGFVQVKVSWIDGKLIVSVQDSGRGIADEDQKRIFNAFEQIGHDSGNGLGLSIVKHLLSAQGGQIYVSSLVDKGTCFEFNIPAHRLDNTDDDSKINHLYLAQRKKTFLKTVLLVEDNPDILKLLQGVFENTECLCFHADTGNEALKLAFAKQPDLVLLDLNLPDISGFNVIQLLRKNGFNNPIFVQSAWVSSEYKAKATAAGCNEYLLKPIDLAHLSDLIEKYFFCLNEDPGMPVERYQQLYMKFIDSLTDKRQVLQGFVDKTENLWSNESRRTIQLYAHRLAGSAGLYGMQDIATSARQLDQLLVDFEHTETCLRQSDLKNEIIQSIQQLIAEFDQQVQIH